jgi:hypothetical protein
MSISTDKLAVFMSDVQSVGGLPLRHPTAGTLLLLEQANNLLLLDKLPQLLTDGALTALDLTGQVAQYVLLHTLPLADVRKMAGNEQACADAMFTAAETIAADKVVDYALAINEALRAMKATRDWEVAGRNGDPFTPPNGPPSTLPKSPS